MDSVKDILWQQVCAAGAECYAYWYLSEAMMLLISAQRHGAFTGTDSTDFISSGLHVPLVLSPGQVSLPSTMPVKQ